MITEEMVLAAAKAMTETPPEEHYEERDGKTILVRDLRQTAFAALEAALTLPSAGEAAELVLVPRAPTLEMQNAGWRRLWDDGVDTENIEIASVYEAMISGAPSPSASEAQVRVKALEWKQGYCDAGCNIVQVSPLPFYQIRQLDGVIWLDVDNHQTIYPSVEAAKAAAQADYERRILSALSTQDGEAESA